MPLAPDHARLSRNVVASEPWLRNQMVSIVGNVLLTLFESITHALLARHIKIQQHVKTKHIVPSQSPEETHLDTAIEKASREQLCQVLRQLCAHSKTATEMTRKHLIPRAEKLEAPNQFVLRSILKKPGSFKSGSQSTLVQPTSASKGTPPSSQMQSKRKATTQCRNCGFEYDPVNANVLACTHHPGKQSAFL